jgi:hypothetical protein
MHYKFSPEEVELLIDLAIERAAEGPTAKFIDDHNTRAQFINWCRIIGELHTPTPITLQDVPPMFLSQVEAIVDSETRARRHIVDSEQEQQREFARREGLDFDKEFGPIDPRARAPRCVHGKLFSEACPACEGRCAHGLTLLEPCAACNRGVQPLVQSP